MRRSSVGGSGAERLAAIPVFADVPLGQRRMLARVVDEISAESGEVIMAQGEHGYEFVVLEHGTAEVSQDGRRIGTLGPGDFFGELAALNDGEVRSATVAALEDVSGLAFTAHFMREIGERLPHLGDRIRQEATARLQADARRAGDTPAV